MTSISRPRITNKPIIITHTTDSEENSTMASINGVHLNAIADTGAVRNFIIVSALPSASTYSQSTYQSRSRSSGTTSAPPPHTTGCSGNHNMDTTHALPLQGLGVDLLIGRCARSRTAKR
jgi:hypothetical protein